MIRLRDYQEECIADLERRFSAGARRVPSVLATGLGKTVIFSALVERWISLNPTKRVLILAHTDELVLQAASQLKKANPTRRIGVVKAERNEVTGHVVVASVQTLRSRRRRAQIRNVGLIIVDECHHATAATYRAVLKHFGALPPELGEEQDFARYADESVIVAGFTATLARGDKQKLSDVWEDCTFKRGISFGIRRGYLLDVRGRRIVVPELDLTNVKKSGGDYADSSLAEELTRSLAPETVARDYKKYAADRKGLCFVPTVQSAEDFAAAFRTEGIPTDVVSGKLGKLERRLILKRLREGDLQVVVNCAVLTEGFDDPTISCVVIARPTRSAPLYQQMVGRGLRPDLSLPASERGDCLVLDVVGASRAHDLRSLVDLSEAEIREEIAEDEELSLLEMEEAELNAEEESAGQEGIQEELYSGVTEAVEFDPLGRTTIGAWLQTGGGTYFLPCNDDAYVLIVPSESEPGQWDVAWLSTYAAIFGHFDCPGFSPYFTRDRQCKCGGHHTGSPGGLTEHTGLPLDMACSWAEEVMEEMGGSLLGASKKKWRKETPRANQIFKARREGIVIPLDENGDVAVSRGELADLITEAIGSRRIDPVVAFMKSQMEA